MFFIDDSIVVSGDGFGKIFFWDWKMFKIIKFVKAYVEVCIGVVWYSFKSFVVVLCSWDKMIKLWK